MNCTCPEFVPRQERACSTVSPIIRSNTSRRSIGVMEYWSIGFSALHYSTTPLLHYSTTPLLHYSTTPLLQHGLDSFGKAGCNVRMKAALIFLFSLIFSPVLMPASAAPAEPSERPEGGVNQTWDWKSS